MLIVACGKRSSNSSLETNLSNRAARPNAKCVLNNQQGSNNPEFRANGLHSRCESNGSGKLNDPKLRVTRQVRREFDNHSRNHRPGLIELPNNKELRNRRQRLNRNQHGLTGLQNKKELRDLRRRLNQEWLGEVIQQRNHKVTDTDNKTPHESSKARLLSSHSRRVTARGKANLRSLSLSA